jgi:hypothetical protein
LLLVRDFILRVKPVYTYPLFVVQLQEIVDEISVVDETTISGTLRLDDSICADRVGASTIFDDYRSAGGTARNDFDNDADPGTSPVFPTPLQPVVWGFDKEWLCPFDQLQAVLLESFAVDFVPEFDSIFAFDVGETYDATPGPPGPSEIHDASASSPFTITPAGTSIPFTDSTVNTAGTLTRLGITFFGLTDTDPDTYIVELQVNGAPVLTSSSFKAGGNTERVWALSSAVSPGDTLTLLVKTTDASPVTPSWTSVSARLFNSSGVWAFDAGETYDVTPGPALFPAGDYGVVRVLVT